MLSRSRVVILVLLGAILVGVYVTPLVKHVLVVGTGYVAKNACSAHLLADRSLAELRTPGAELASPLLLHRLLDSLLSFEVLSLRELRAEHLDVDVELGSLAVAVRCAFLFPRLLAVERIALFRPSLGCTLLPDCEAASRLLADTPLSAYRQHLALRAESRALRDSEFASRADADEEGEGAEEDDDPSTALLWPHSNRVARQAQLSATQWNAEVGTLAWAVQAAFAEHYGSDNPKLTRSLVVVQHGRIVASRSAPSFSNALTPQLGWSMTKSVLNALVGIRVEQGAMRLDDPVHAPEWPAEDDARHNITVRHLLQMTCGLDFPEKYSPLSPVPRMLFHDLDTAHAGASSPLKHAPGTHWYYSSAASNVLSRALRHSFDTHQEYLRFPREALFAPLGMHTAVMEPDVAGNFVGSSYMYASALDWARFGQLYLQRGEWQGRRLLSADWVDFSLSPVDASPKRRYGAHWWLNRGDLHNTTDRYMRGVPSDASMCLGHDGQLVVVLPSQNAVVVRLGLTRGGEEALDAEGMLSRIIAAL